MVNGSSVWPRAGAEVLGMFEMEEVPNMMELLYSVRWWLDWATRRAPGDICVRLGTRLIARLHPEDESGGVCSPEIDPGRSSFFGGKKKVKVLTFCLRGMLSRASCCTLK